jgi:hypothetical protein
MMNQEIKKEWVADLRSGKIIKNKYALRQGKNRMCVLGALCNVHAKHHPEIAAAQPKMNEYMGESTIIPMEVAEWAGLGRYNTNPCVVHKGYETSLMSLNDDEGLTFKTLANLIEAQL